MNLGGAPSINLSEAARFLKQSNVGSNSIQNQQVPPPMIFMQQAVAMQQFQFQQALLMQQVMATQQAAARAATVKSAQEMAAARAAEISKLLKGIESDVDKKKRSPRRFISQTPSRSRSQSRSFSRSKSQSPLPYRRDRSTSRSPIRYRRDSRPSPISRDYFGYRGRSRRRYYRGRGEYGWNLSYRRDWERERDSRYSLYAHRSRSRSRSQVSCRAHTPSGSPRSRRERSGTPLRLRHKRQRLEHSSRHTRSHETKVILSCSQSRSYSRSRSCSESLHHEHGSQSPIQRPRDKKTGGNHGQTRISSLELLGSEKCILIKNPDTNGMKEKVYPTTVILKDEDIVERWRFESENKIEQSISPARSLSVSLSPPKKNGKNKLERVSKSNDWKKAMVRSVLLQRLDEVATMNEPPQDDMASFTNVEDGEGNPNAFADQQTDIKGDVISKEGELDEKKHRGKKEFDQMRSTFDNNDEDKEINDELQGDIKANELEKTKSKEHEQKSDYKEEEKQILDIPIVKHEHVKDHTMMLLEHPDMGTSIQKNDSSLAFEDQGNGNANIISQKNTGNVDVIFVKPTFLDETLVNGLCIKEKISNTVLNGDRDREDGVEIDEEHGDATNEKDTKFDDASDSEGDSGLIFEGPLLPPDLDLGMTCKDLEEKSYAMKKCKNSIEKTKPQELSVAIEEEVVVIRKKVKSKSKEVEDVHGLPRSKDKLLLKDDNQLYEKCKLKEKSEVREKNRNKRHNDKSEYEKHKEKHRKHKKRHRKNEVEIEIEENDNDENKNVDFSKSKEERHRHYNKKHGRGQIRKEEKHEKRRHRHKHRRTLTLEPLDNELLVVEAEIKDKD